MNKNISLIFSLFFFLGVIFVSCASAPKVSLPEGVEDMAGERELYMLPAGGRAYIWIDTVKARPFLDAFSIGGISDKHMARILDSTESAVAAVFPEEHERRFFLAATGSFPVFTANLSLTFNRNWKRQKSRDGSKYWYSQNDGIALALGSNLALVSNTDPYTTFTSETPPSGFVEFRRGLPLAGWMPNPSETINNVIISMGVPVQIPAEDFFFGASRLSTKLDSTGELTDVNPADTELWEPVFKIRTPSASHARSLLALFSVARMFIQRGLIGQNAEWDAPFLRPQEAAALLFANIPEQDEDFLILRTVSLKAATIALLFRMFSIYSE